VLTTGFKRPSVPVLNALKHRTRGLHVGLEVLLSLGGPAPPRGHRGDAGNKCPRLRRVRFKAQGCTLAAAVSLKGH
jgi:hypothetical protein